VRSSNATDLIERIGTRIVRCNRQCDGIECRQKEGYYPRLFFLEPSNSPEVKVLIVGENPGHSSLLEREFYKALGEQHHNKLATYKECQTVWRAIAYEHPYYERPRDLIKKLGLGEKGLLWAEAVFCEMSGAALRIPVQTFENCREQFLREVIETLVPWGKHIVCLGGKAFKSVKEVVGQDNHWKVIGVHHPTGRSSYANYFAKQGKNLVERPLKGRFRGDFRKLDESAAYLHWFKPE
jgi:uracil-DNA glycosylase